MKELMITLLILASVPALNSCAPQANREGSDVLLKLEADFARAVAERGHDGFVSYFAEDGVELADGGGINSRNDLLKQGAWPPDMALSWTPVKAEMAAFGDLGYTYGNYLLKTKSKDGRLVTHYGKYVSIWKKQKDGSWEVALDMGNSSPTPDAQN